jgi:hypothetical protein
MKPRHALALAALATVGWGSCEMTNIAGAAPNCGGQSAAPQPVPYDCDLPGIDITYQGVTRHFSAHVHADGTHVTVTYLMSTPLPVDVPIRIVHHEGVSGAGLASDSSQGVIPAGAVTATLVDSSPCRDGQLDVKAVFIGNGQSQGRVGGPWIRNGTDCTTTTTVPQSSTTSLPTSTSSSAPPPTTTPTSTVPSTVGSTAPTSPPQSGGGGASSTNLPATGSDLLPRALIGVVLFGLGAIVLEIKRRAS